MRLPVDGLQGRTLPSSVRFADSFPRGGSLLAADFLLAFSCCLLYTWFRRSDRAVHLRCTPEL